MCRARERGSFHCRVIRCGSDCFSGEAPNVNICSSFVWGHLIYLENSPVSCQSPTHILRALSCALCPPVSCSLQRWERGKCLAVWNRKGDLRIHLFLIQTLNMCPFSAPLHPSCVCYLVPLVSEPPPSTGRTSIASPLHPPSLRLQPSQLCCPLFHLLSTFRKCPLLPPLLVSCPSKFMLFLLLFHYYHFSGVLRRICLNAWVQPARFNWKSH